MLERKGLCSIDGRGEKMENETYSLHKFKLYETRSNFYLIGRDKQRIHWRVLKIDRLDPSELIIRDDPTAYTQNECNELLRRIDEGNKSTGGLKFVTNCYGIVGFIKFLEPYYLILVTKRRRIGVICGHDIYGVTGSKIIMVPHPSVRTNLACSKDEQRYKKLLSTVDLTKDFFFSYTYRVMSSLQKNLSNDETGQVLYDTMFVWNDGLTQGIRKCLNNTLWTVALVYGFFKQVKLAISGRHFILTLIARRSRYYAGTRYLKRGVNDKGRVANDVETEQIIFEDISGGYNRQISSVVQHRGSIPLYWSQEITGVNLKPDITLHRKDPTYQATRLHFENLVKRYGNPIIILNLIKAFEKKPRETVLSEEFANAIEVINRDLPEESQLKFIPWDLHKFSRSNSANILQLLSDVAAGALDLTGFFYSKITPDLKMEKGMSKNNLDNRLKMNMGIIDDVEEIYPSVVCDCPNNLIEYGLQNSCTNDSNACDSGDAFTANNVKELGNKPLYQRGILRTNCIDCLDRTNVAQYAYGLVAMGRQLNALGLIDVPEIDLDSSLAEALMGLYETMGDTLALQYGGSAAHNKVFSQKRGWPKAATNSQEFFRAIQRFYSNVYLDAEKQDAINVFLGHFQPKQGKPALWELESDQNCNIGRRGDSLRNENTKSHFQRSLSDGDMLMQNVISQSTTSDTVDKPIKGEMLLVGRSLQEETSSFFCDSSPNNQRMCVERSSHLRCIPSATHRHILRDYNGDQCLPSDKLTKINGQGREDTLVKSNSNDMDWLYSSANSCDEDASERYSVTSITSIIEIDDSNIEHDQGSETEKTDKPQKASDQDKETPGMELAVQEIHRHGCSLGETPGGECPSEFSSTFVDWVCHGHSLVYSVTR